MKPRIAIGDEVGEALAGAQPVVALESTIVTHGMPHPENLDTARMVEADIRSEGAIPATIAVMDGVLRVGLSDDDLLALSRAEGVAKLSRADLAIAMAEGWTGSTTVAATMIAARVAGIEVFATGGIGGVHAGGETSLDISADLQELSQSPVIVVAAGAKAILDIPRTLEVLETLGVPVIAYGQDEFPAFWSRNSGLPAPVRLDSPAALAAAFLSRRQLGVGGGQLVANPIPAADEIPSEDLVPVIAHAIAEADREGVQGKAVTPFLLDRIYHLTDGRSLAANIALVRNNARLSAQIAAALATLRSG